MHLLQEKFKVLWGKKSKKAKRTCSFIRQFRICWQSIPLWLRELHKMSLASLLLIFGIWQLFFEFNCSKLRKQISWILVKGFFFGTYQNEIGFLNFEQLKKKRLKNHNKCDVIFNIHMRHIPKLTDKMPKTKFKILKFIYSEKATKFCEIFTLLLTGTT